MLVTEEEFKIHMGMTDEEFKRFEEDETYWKIYQDVYEPDYDEKYEDRYDGLSLSERNM